MIIILRIVEQKIKNLSIDDLKKVADSYHISYTEDEINLLYQFLLDHYEDLLQQNIRVFEIIRPKISSKLYQQLLELYIDLKQKYL